MGLILGKSLNRSYNIRIPLMDAYYDIGIFYNTKSSFLLFGIDSDFSQLKDLKYNPKIAMFKNIESSKFCGTFLNLHNYHSNNLDIINQFKSVKSDYSNDIVNVINENIILSKIKVDESQYCDQVLIYGFTLTDFHDNFIFILTERHNIDTKRHKKIVRTSGIQIASSKAIESVDLFYDEYKNSKEFHFEIEKNINTKTIILE